MLYGRDAERARIGELLEAARSARSGALVVRGEPGIGKTALLEDTRDRAADMHVLTARGVESESELPFAALHQLLRPAFSHMERLPEPQAAALRGALGLGDGSGQERFLVFAACLSLLSELAEQRPVLCLVDDAHWLDAASADALRFVARRLDAEGVVLLLGAREGDVRAFEAADVPSLVLHGLDAEATATLLARGVGVEAAPGVRDRLLELTRGNALALLEVPAALTAAQLAGEEPLPEALPLTRQVERAFLERVHRLDEHAQRFLLVAAADDSENVALVSRAAAGLGVDPLALDEAERAGLVAIRGVRLDFRHPLVRSAVYAAATSTERRAAHRALADVLADDDTQADRRAWHLAASVLEHDEGVVGALEEAAERAEERGAYEAAARALERAAALSVDGPARGRRLTRAATCASIAGADAYAGTLARQALRLIDEPLQRAEIAHVLALEEMRRGRPLDGVPMLLDAAREISSIDAGKALALLIDVSRSAAEGGSFEAQLDAYRLAATIVPSPEDDVAVFALDLLTGLGALAEGKPDVAAPALERAVSWGTATEDSGHILWAGTCALWLGHNERAAALFERAASLARARGELEMLAPALGSLSLHHLFAQRFDEAALAGLEALEAAREAGADNLAPMPLGIVAVITAIRGGDDESSRLAGEALERASAHGLRLGVAWGVWAQATLDLSRGRWAEALARLEPLVDALGAVGELLVMQFLPDLIEAAVRAGRPEAGRAALRTFEVWAEHSRAPWAQPRLLSCRALVAGGEEATGLFEQADRLSADARPFDLARMQLLYGEHLRRERRRTDARVQLRSALEAFERIRAEPWAERARIELRASGETARKRDPSAVSQLTPQELHIARLVADGLSNKEVAAQLFLSPRTIDSHLRNVFGKLGVTSRTQLARIPLGGDGAVPLGAAASTA